MISFGTGILTVTPSGANPTPANVGILQDVSVDISYSEKELRGAYQFAVDVARAGAKLTAKAKSGQFNAALYQAFLSGSTVAAGSKIGVSAETAAVPTTPYQITVANSATFYEDLGVLDTNSGLYMTRVASAPATGQYSVAAGVYTFAAADTTHVMQINYSYTAAAVGKTVSMTNQLMGAAVTFTLTLFNTYKTKNSGIRLWAVSSTKLSMALKNEDHTMTDIDFVAQADAQGRVVDLYSAD